MRVWAPSAGLVANSGTEDRGYHLDSTEDCSQRNKRDSCGVNVVAFVDKKLINCQSKKETEKFIQANLRIITGETVPQEVLRTVWRR